VPPGGLQTLRVFAAIVSYVIGAQSWSQSFEAAVVDDDELNALALANDLAVRGTVDDDDSWVVLSAQSSSPH